MKPLPLSLNVLAVVALSASLAYWALKMFPAPQRPITAPPLAAAAEPRLDAAAGLFGGQTAAVVVSSYQLRGVVAAVAGSPRGSVAILAYDNQPAQALPVGAEVVSGVSVKEVHPQYVLLSEGGVIKRVDLAVEARTPDGGAGAPARTPVPLPAQAVPQPVVPQPAPAFQLPPQQPPVVRPAGNGPAQ